jgi:hypothetical protein
VTDYDDDLFVIGAVGDRCARALAEAGTRMGLVVLRLGSRDCFSVAGADAT